MTQTIHKIVAREQLAALVDQDHAAGKRIICTNGVFDLMHVGHLRYLQAARALGDILVVGVNSDASTRRLKGNSRPYIPEDERAEMLTGLACVDIVTIFPEDTATELVRIVRPHIYTKGGDYGVTNAAATTTTPTKTLPEAPTVIAQGGQIILLPYLPQHSTTELVQRVKNAQ